MAQALPNSAPDTEFVPGQAPFSIEDRVIMVGKDGNADVIDFNRYNRHHNFQNNNVLPTLASVTQLFPENSPFTNRGGEALGPATKHNETPKATLLDTLQPAEVKKSIWGEVGIVDEKVDYAAKLVRHFPRTNDKPKKADNIAADEYGGLRKIINEDLADPESTPEGHIPDLTHYKVDTTIVTGSKKTVPTQAEKDAFARFFTPEKPDEDYTGRLTKLGRYIVTIGHKVNGSLERLVKFDELKPNTNKKQHYEARHAAEKRYITRARKLGQPLIELRDRMINRVNEKAEAATEKPVKPRSQIENELHMYDEDLALTKVTQQFDMFNKDLKTNPIPLSPINRHSPLAPADASKFLANTFPTEAKPEAKTEKTTKAS